jgi:hypothetical protein
MAGNMTDPLPEPEQPRSATWHTCPHTVRAHREALERVIELAEAEEYPGHRHESGVLYVGGGRYWPGIVVGCRLLRRLGYAGPIQVWHGHRADPEPVHPEDVAGLDVEIVGALAVAERTRPRILRGWEAKLHAIRHCDMRRVLYLDADAYCVADPTAHLEALTASHPFAFWRDLSSAERNVRWPMVWPAGAGGVPQIQGGQLWLDRERAWPLILTADWMCQHSDYYYRHGFGDQDCWRIALAAGGWRWMWHDLGAAEWRHPAFVCRLNDNPVVVHRCRGKLWRVRDIPAHRRTYSGPRYYLPREPEVWDIMAEVCARDSDPVDVFSAIYRAGLWSASSTDPQGEAAEYVRLISAMAIAGGWRSAVDAGCGDGRVARAIAERTGMTITGIDCVTEVIGDPGALYTPRVGDITDVDALPPGDVLLVKDVLHHWPSEMISRWLAEVVASERWRVLVCTQDRHQHGAQDTHLGGYRGLDPRGDPLVAGGWHAVIEYQHKAICVRRLS